MIAGQTDDAGARAGAEQFEGRSACQTFVLTARLIEGFAELSGDRSPIHVDEAFARRRGLKSCVAHGALLGALTSCVLGMELPGAAGMLQELSLRFHKPSFAGDTLTVRVTVASVVESVQTLLLKVQITNQDNETVATGKAQSGIYST